jgi:hypothetical protein
VKHIVITITILLLATLAYAQDYSAEIAKTQSEIARLESQKRLSADMEPKGLRRSIAQKKEYLNELVMMQNGATYQDIQLRKQQKQLNRMEGKINSIQANQW